MTALGESPRRGRPSSSSRAQARVRNPRGGGAQLRSDLIAAASRLLETLPGEESLSLRAVAREAGVAAPSVYLHFADKSELMDAVLAERFGEFGRALGAAVAARSGPADRLRGLAEAYCAFAAEHPGHYRVMFTAVPSGADGADGADRSDGSDGADGPVLPGAQIVDRVADLVRACPGGDADPRRTAILLWCGLHGIVALRESKPSFAWPAQDALVVALLGALLPDAYGA